MSTVFIMFTLWIFLPNWLSKALLAFGFLVLVSADFLRLKNEGFNRFLTGFFGPIMRSSELHRLAGTTYLITGSVLTAFFFNKGVVALSLLFLAFADPIASYVGIKYGKDKLFGHKSVQGFVAAFAVCTGLCYLFLFYNRVQDYILIASLLAGLVGSLSELIPVGKLDDNFSMPVLSSIGLSILFYFFDYFSYFI
ncbi:MAG: hypothetical protein AABY53_07935 [Bdellovibrionota bacterium]